MASRLAPQMAEPTYFLAMTKKEQGDYSGASALFQDVVKLQPRNVSAWYQLGTSLERDAKPKEAIAAWRQAIAIDPDHTQSLSHLANDLPSTDPAEAAHLKARIAAVQEKEHLIDQARAVAHDAIASMQADDWPEAMKGMKKALQICGDCNIKAALHKNIGLISCDIGDLDDGETELRLALALEPGDRQVERALALVAQVRAAHVSTGPLVNTMEMRGRGPICFAGFLQSKVRSPLRVPSFQRERTIREWFKLLFSKPWKPCQLAFQSVAADRSCPHNGLGKSCGAF